MSDLRLVPAIPELAPGTRPATREVDAAALEDAELRLLAQAVGDHLPAELHARVLQLRARRARPSRISHERVRHACMRRAQPP